MNGCWSLSCIDIEMEIICHIRYISHCGVEASHHGLKRKLSQSPVWLFKLLKCRAVEVAKS